MLESKRRATIFFILSLLLAATAGFLVLHKVQNMNSNLGTLVKVYVAKSNIPSRTLIKPSDVKTDEIPKKYLRDYHITDSNDLINKVSVVPLSSGDIITKNILKRAAELVNENDRIITMMQSNKVYFDESLEAQDRVDIIVSDQFSGNKQTSVFMTDVKVVSVAMVKGSFKGARLEIPFDMVPRLINFQNYADNIRIVKANVGKEHMNTKPTSSEGQNSTSNDARNENKNVVDEKAPSKINENKGENSVIEKEQTQKDQPKKNSSK